MKKKKEERNKQSNKTKTPVKASYPIVLGETKGKLKLSKQLMEQINLLHEYVGAKEWSGPVLYSIIKGDINNPEELELEAHGMYPMDIGTSAYTEYDFEMEEIMDMHDYYPEIVEKGWRTGHMHTHHNMPTYFSGTDEEELTDNTPNHAYYLSLIVNFKKEYVARLCVMGKREIIGNSNIKYTNIQNEETVSNTSSTKEEEIVYAIDLDVEFEDSQLPFLEEILKIESRQKARRPAPKPFSRYNHGIQTSFPGLGYTVEDVDIETSSWTDSHIDTVEDCAERFLCKITQRDAYVTHTWAAASYDLNKSWEASTEVTRLEILDKMGDKFNDVYHEAFIDPQMLHFEDNMDTVLQILWEDVNTYNFATPLMEYLETFTVKETA